MLPHERFTMLFSIAFVMLFLAAASNGATQYFDFKIQYTNVTRLCHTKTLISVNGQFPGPTQYVREGDFVVVNVTNLVSTNVTIHWHGVRQLLTSWADGPAYITQCPVQPNASYVHKFQIVDQRGTLLWHAHLSWLRATLHGAFIILRKESAFYPFKNPINEIPIVLGEWWNANVEDIIADALATGGAYNISDALTINGQPGFLYNCSSQDAEVFNVTKGQYYLLRIVNAAVNFHLYFAVAQHSLTVVEIDAVYTQPYTTDVVVLAPGQTTNVLLHADQAVGRYYMAASVFSPAPIARVPFPNVPTTAIINYVGANQQSSSLSVPNFPAYNDTAYVANFTQSLRGQPFSKGYFYYDVPQKIDEDLLFTVGYALQPCSNCSFSAFPGDRLSASMNNVTFDTPNISILQAYYNQISGVYEPDFPDVPPYQYNYTGVNPTNKFAVLATKVKVLKFNSLVQIVLQDTATLFFESHPIHLHGQNFYIVGSGFGNYNSTSDPAKFNLKDPPARNTVAVPAGGWAAIRFRATNPGVWYMHCHIDLHNVWGMSMAFVVKNGNKPSEILPPPPSDQPPC